MSKPISFLPDRERFFAIYLKMNEPHFLSFFYSIIDIVNDILIEKKERLIASTCQQGKCFIGNSPFTYYMPKIFLHFFICF